MDCTEARAKLGILVDGELAADEVAAVERHLADCPTCERECVALRALARRISTLPANSAPVHLWNAIERKLNQSVAPVKPSGASWLRRRSLALAACLFLAVGLGSLITWWSGGAASTANAAVVDFGPLLDGLRADPRLAFSKFLSKYQAKKTSATEAIARAPDLNFDIPNELPGGFKLEEAFTLRFGDQPGAAAMYMRNGEFLGAIFHPPVQQEAFGTHKDYSCVIGQHRGHAVAVGDWKLVHLTDATTCHCVLSKLNEHTELPSVLATVAPHSSPTMAPASRSGHDH